MTRARWHRLDKWNVVLVLIGTAVLALWLALPSTLFLRVVGMTVEGDTVRFIRQTPYGPVTARWFTEIVTEGGLTCSPNQWQVSHYEPDDDDTVIFPLWDWARPCVYSGRPFHMTTTRSVLLAGVIPLRANRTSEGPMTAGLLRSLPLAPPAALVAPAD